MRADGRTVLHRLMDKIAESPHGPEPGELTRGDWIMVDLIGPTDEKAQALGFESLDQ